MRTDVMVPALLKCFLIDSSELLHARFLMKMVVLPSAAGDAAVALAEPSAPLAFLAA